MPQRSPSHERRPLSRTASASPMHRLQPAWMRFPAGARRAKSSGSSRRPRNGSAPSPASPPRSPSCRPSSTRSPPLTTPNARTGPCPSKPPPPPPAPPGPRPSPATGPPAPTTGSPRQNQQTRQPHAPHRRPPAPHRHRPHLRRHPVPLENRICLVTCESWGCQAARVYSLIRPLRTGLRWIRSRSRPATVRWPPSCPPSGTRWAMPWCGLAVL